jgi:hypothetical protein
VNDRFVSKAATNTKLMNHITKQGVQMLATKIEMKEQKMP